MVKLVQVGCGEHARVAHGPAQRRCAAERRDLVLAGCCDLDPGRADAFRRDFGHARAYSDLAAMLEAERPDAAAVVVPTERTVEVASRLLERGLPLLLEKPPGTTAADVDRLIAAAEAGGRAVPVQVAFNRRFAPLVQAMRHGIEQVGPLQHVHYEMARVERRDPDFSTTAVHGLDAVRYLAGGDYAEARFRYRELPELGQGIANALVDAVMTTGATAQLAFTPVAGVLVERAAAHAHGDSFFLNVPMWGGVDSPGRLWRFRRGELAAELGGDSAGDGTALFELGGFYRETVAFLDALSAGDTPSPGLRDSRQSVAMAEHIRERRSEYRP